MTNSTGSAAHVAGLMPGDASNTLANEDLLPTTAAQRHWTWKDFAALWVGMVVCVPTYTMASSMLDQGFTWQMAVWLVFLANCIVLVPESNNDSQMAGMPALSTTPDTAR